MEQKLRVSSNPHVREKMTTSQIMKIVAAALLPASLFGIYNFGIRALYVMLASVISAVAFEYLFNRITKEPTTVGDFSAVVTGMLIGMNMPAQIPLWIPVLGSAFAIIVVKQLFGGLGQNFMNPALAARCFLLISFAGRMTDFSVTDSFRGVTDITDGAVDGLAGATPLAALKEGGTLTASSLRSLFLGNTMGTIGETSVLFILIGAMILLIFKVIDLRIPLSYIGSFAVFTVLWMLGTGKGFDGSFLLAEICAGGLMLGAWFMATDYSSSPITPAGRIVFGCFLGIMTGVFRLVGSSAEGVSYAIIIGNLLVPIIEKYTQPRVFGKPGLFYKPDQNKEKGSKGKNRILHDTIAITIITLAAGLVLGIVYDTTKDPISTQEQQAKEQAYQTVFEEAASFETLFEGEDADLEAYLDEEGFSAQNIDEMMTALGESGEVLGYVMTVTTKEGYGGDIQFALGVQLDGTLNAISILSISETAGLGMRANTPAFQGQFSGKKVDAFRYVKDGADEDEEIDALSGATVTTKAMTNGVNAALAAYRYELSKGGDQA